MSYPPPLHNLFGSGLGFAQWSHYLPRREHCQTGFAKIGEEIKK
jgi:hypothetical protein